MSISLKTDAVVVSRRSFLLTSGAFTVGVAFIGPALTAPAMSTFTPNAWVTIGSDDIVTIYFALAEMGQGIKTTLPLLVAEELDVDWAKVRVVQSPSDVKIYGNDGVLGTFGSTSTRFSFEKLRLAGVQARKILLLNAAEHWKLPLDELSTDLGKVVHKKSGRIITYGALAETARVPDPLPVVTKADFKSASDFRYIGKSMPRIDVPSKVDGTAIYGIDTQLADMLYGAILRTPVQGEKPEKIDDTAARAVPGVIKIVALPYGIGIIADSVEAAKQAKIALTVQWSNQAKARTYSSDAMIGIFSAIARDTTQGGVSIIKEGDVQAALKMATKVVSTDYLSDHAAHMTMEPMNATGLVNPDTVEIWASNQAPSNIQNVVSKAAGLAPEKIIVHSTLLGGGFGRRYEADFAVDAYMLAKEMPGRPVKVILSREDDLQNDLYRPLIAQHIKVALNADGNIIGWWHRLVGESYLSRVSPTRMAKMGGKDPVVAGGGGFKYLVGTHAVEYVRQDRGVAVGAYRGISSGYVRFAVESLIDEIAALKQADPLGFRLDLVRNDPRGIKVLETATRMADWTRKRPGHGLGLSYSDDLGSYLAVVAEISVAEKTGEIRVHTLWCAVDAGLAVQPVNLAAQIEGGLLFGLGAALFEQVNIKDGVTTESNFTEYRVLRMSDMPEVYVEVLSTDNPPTGVGEAGVIAIAPAIANAFALMNGGIRLRHLPLLPERVKMALA